MSIEIVRESAADLAAYASVPIAFRVTETLDLASLPSRRESVELRTVPIAAPYEKDYDVHVGQRPLDWPLRFNVTNWAVLAAYLDGQRIGGATVVMHDDSVDLREGRSDLAVLWDLRIAPAFRRSGVGTELLSAAEQWAREQGAQEFKVETQHINVAACRFYARRGFVLGAVNPGAYAELPDEVQLFWYKSLFIAEVHVSSG